MAEEIKEKVMRLIEKRAEIIEAIDFFNKKSKELLDAVLRHPDTKIHIETFKESVRVVETLLLERNEEMLKIQKEIEALYDTVKLLKENHGPIQ